MKNLSLTKVPFAGELTGNLLYLRKLALVCLFLQFWSSIFYLFCGLLFPEVHILSVVCGIVAIIISLTPLFFAIRYKTFLVLFSCISVFNIAPIWFLYLEAVLPGYDAYDYITPGLRMETFFWIALFLIFINITYITFWSSISRFSIETFSVLSSINLKPIFYQRATIICFTFPLIGFYYFYQSFDLMWTALTAGRAANGLVIDSVGTLSGMLVPINSVWQLTPLSGVIAFVSSKKNEPLPILSLLLGVVVSFSFFLSGSRGIMMYVAAPFFLFLFYYNWDRGLRFWTVATVTLFALIGIMEFQVRFRGNLLDVIVDPARASQERGYTSVTTFDPTESHRDNNMYLLCLMIQSYPAKYAFKGFDGLFITLINPIPRAVWPGKPYHIGAMDLSQQPTFVLEGPLFMGTTSLTYSVVGEAYQSEGTIGLFVYAILYGVFLLFFDGITFYANREKPISVGVLGVGIFLAFWGFRALFALVSFSYPIIALILFIKVVHYFKPNANHIHGT